MNIDLDTKLRFAAQSKRFIDQLDFVVGLTKQAVYTPINSQSLAIRNDKVLPIFTTERALQLFQINSENQLDFEERMLFDFLPEVVASDIDTIGFNIRPKRVENYGNQQYYRKVLFIEMIENVQKVLAEFEENQNKGELERWYFIPAFVSKNNVLAGTERRFAALTAPDERSYIPLFDNFESLNNWYSEPYFAQILNDNEGEILVMTIEDLLNPKEGRNEFSFARGVTINPLDQDIEEFQKTLMSWSELEKK